MSFGTGEVPPGAVEDSGLVAAPPPPPTKVIIDDGGTQQAYVHQAAGVQAQYGHPSQYPPPYPPPHQQPPMHPNMGPPVPRVNVVMNGTCPQCRIGFLVEEYTGCGIALAVIFFPIGLLCCLLIKGQRCPHCGWQSGDCCC